jgi:hypothetical protein
MINEYNQIINVEKMENQYIKHPEIKLVGISVRTNNKNEFDPTKAKIGSMINFVKREKIM